MSDIRRWIDDTEVSLAFYGSIVYLAVVSALGSQTSPPTPTGAISAVVASGSVLYVAHVFAASVPKAARAGRLHRRDLLSALRHDAPLLASLVVPVAPLLLATSGVVSVGTGYRLSVRVTIAMLFALAVLLSRRDGLPWRRAIVAGIVIIAIAVAVIWLESRVH
ncbi:MAG TPA: hypothetical protein VFZ96_10380 [Actinomycetota bacterium]|nr:hypothetical protein [Actinomycetota bacterium]